MILQIHHATRYAYTQPVALGRHVVRMTPRGEPSQRVISIDIEIKPDPVLISQCLDANGNSVVNTWFSGEAGSLDIHASMIVETTRGNPFDFLLDLDAVRIPISYGGESASLQPCLAGAHADAELARLHREVEVATAGYTLDFLSLLCQRINNECSQATRRWGDPHPPEVTWGTRAGSCRDLAVLFIAVCRGAGLAARFVSGYHEGAVDQTERHLHAWAEVYLPGGGWRGFDPSMGLAVSDGHVALAAAPTPAACMALSGTYRGEGISSNLETEIHLKTFMNGVEQKSSKPDGPDMAAMQTQISSPTGFQSQSQSAG